MSEELLRLEVTFSLLDVDGAWNVSAWDITGCESRGELVLSDAQARRLLNLVLAAKRDERRRVRAALRAARSEPSARPELS